MWKIRNMRKEPGLTSAYAEYTKDTDHIDRSELPPGMKAAIRRIAKEV